MTVSPMTVSPMTVTAVSVSPMPAAVSAVAATPLGEGRHSREKRQCDNNRGRSQQI